MQDLLWACGQASHRKRRASHAEPQLCCEKFQLLGLSQKTCTNTGRYFHVAKEKGEFGGKGRRNRLGRDGQRGVQVLDWGGRVAGVVNTRGLLEHS